ncbi:RepB family plasmid replication initiator protein [Thaumasiovibrio sp. DFM-14]|uniref:RepB family plasmid replication initiator protein n=1 Tax=Thaumasiovibrio sp. DFM-14 TaxID=3384792 RepID=UPI0039A1A1B4
MKKPTKKNPLVKQANALTTAAYTLSRVEKRLVYMGLMKIVEGSIKSNELGQYPVEIKHSEYTAIFEDRANNASRDINKASKDLNRREVCFYLPDEDGEDGEKAEDGISWTTKRSHRPRRGTTTMFFNKELVDIITAVDDNYTRFLLTDAGNLTNPHFMRLFESLSQWSKKKTITFRIDWMLERYELPKSYSRMSDFRRRFLHPAVEEINKKTYLDVKAEEIKDPSTKKPSMIKFTYNQSELPLLSDEAKINTLHDDSPELEGFEVDIFPETEFDIERAREVYTELLSGLALDVDDLLSFKGFIPQLMNEGYEIGDEFYKVFKSALDHARNPGIALDIFPD